LLAACTTNAPKPSAETPKRIISVVPNVTETLFAYGLGDKVIAVGDYDEFPPEVAKKPKVGGLINPNIEQIIAMDPGLGVTYGSENVLRERLQSVGIRMFPVVHGNVEQTLQFMMALGKEVGAEDRARALVAEIRQSFETARAGAPKVRPKVFLVHD